MSDSEQKPINSSFIIKCAICDDKAHGVHFGVNACRACAAFYRRSIIFKRKYKCRFSNNCDVNKGVRCVCRCCRFRKCVEEGMDPKVLEKHHISEQNHKLLGSPPESEMENNNTPQSQQIVIPQQQISAASEPLPSFIVEPHTSAFIPVNLPAKSPNLLMENGRSYALLSNSVPLPSTTDAFHLPLPSHSNFVSNVINNLNLGGLFGAELPRIPIASADPTPVVSEILRGYRKLCSLRKATERLIETSQSHKLFDPAEERMELSEVKFDDHLHLVKHDLPLLSEMISEHFQPFGSFSTETKWNMMRNFYPTFILSERSFITKNTVQSKDDDRIFFNHRFYAHLSNVQNFFQVQQCLSTPGEMAKIFRPVFWKIRHYVADNMFDLKMTEPEFCALMGICLWNDFVTGLSPEESRIVQQSRDAIFSELYIICQQGRNIEESGIRFAKIVNMMPTIHRLSFEIGQNFSMVKMMNIFDVDSFVHSVHPDTF